ncbi:MAG: hypothetical protein RBG13Loki_4321 [Promethearchaeota archaeon CR_4]|nr:MAG: hypothetical protein RBG13Loki_4321 [Candidatus Lokiarchaeota archaeon CR_4]
MFPFVALNFEGVDLAAKRVFTGYDPAYLSLLIANILRDIGMTGGMLNLMRLFVAATQIRFGWAKCQKVLLTISLPLSWSLFFSHLKGVLQRFTTLGPFINTYTIVLLLIGHAVWTLSPILIYIGIHNTGTPQDITQ